ncbi:MAG: metallophosphoesterase family protein [Phreatobacter sp.]|uniref:metallophosphoesterase family protein n=1 Tax=Phreatobacter sp. TaxID=1966341 RepID=UPI0027362117|nr:metallophosphoesterase family protein [Phreatobacter sp.]MDP2800364.1 metallophosphoesterase family protein [Phreatobacter sp.]
MTASVRLSRQIGILMIAPDSLALLPTAPLLVFGGPYSNLQAMQALLAEAARLGISGDRIVCTGDIVAYGADPAACCDLAMASGMHVLMGNCEQNLAAGSADCGCGFDEGTECDRLSSAWYAYAAGQISSAHQQFMAACPQRITIGLPDGRRLAVIHGGASDISRFLFASTDDAVLADEIADTGCDGVIAGHCGIPFVREVGAGLWLNAGAIGMPAHDGTPRVWFSVLTLEPDGLRVDIRPLSYDQAGAAAAMRAARLPEGYAAGLETGLWPSEDVLPPAEKASRGVPLQPVTHLWRAEVATRRSGTG